MRLGFPPTQIRIRLALPAFALTAALALLLGPASALAQTTPKASPRVADGSSPAEAATPASAPPASGEFFPLSEVHRGLTGTAWTVFTGTQPEPMKVEILGVLHGARGPGQDMILARLHGREARVHRRGGRHERQPGLYRQPVAGRALLPHRPIQQRPHRGHYAHRADARSAGPAHREPEISGQGSSCGPRPGWTRDSSPAE